MLSYGTVGVLLSALIWMIADLLLLILMSFVSVHLSITLMQLRSLVVSEMVKTMSSANASTLAPASSICPSKSSTYKLNSDGDSTAPCGTPLLISIVLSLSMLADVCLSKEITALVSGIGKSLYLSLVRSF